MADHDHFSILAVDDDDDLRGVIVRRFLRHGHDVEQTASPVEALRRAEQKHFDVAILDIALPEMDGVQLLEQLRQVDPETQAIMLTASRTVETAIRAMKLGAYDYLSKPCELAELELQVERAFEKARLARENRTLKAVLRRTEPPGEIIGTTPVIRRVLCLIAKVATTDSSVLIQGESGTGKELVARALHRGSPRADQPMVVINCAALHESLLESELFGHEKGAFTSAVTAKPGLFELADGGTLFIDEIGEMAPPLQAKLLRALEDGRIRRVGSTREIQTNIRFVAATNKDLAQEVAASRFRDDLYYRLNVITITMPPLRERTEDIPLLVRHVLTLDLGGPRHIEPEALECLVHHRWPGNVRELANVIERAKILGEGPSITVGDLPEELRWPRPSEMSRWALERQQILRAMEEAGGNKVQAARALGISRRRLYRLLEKHGLDDPATA